MFSSVCRASSRTHTFLYMCCELPCLVGPWTLTQCPVCELAISPGPDSWGAGVSLPARADSCSFPSSCPLTVEPCAASTSPECQHSCSYFVLTSQALCIFFFFFFFTLLPVRPLARSLPFSRRTGMFICRTFSPLPLFMFPIVSTFCRNAGLFMNVTAAEWQLLCIANIIPQTWVIIHHLLHCWQQQQQVFTVNSTMKLL